MVNEDPFSLPEETPNPFSRTGDAPVDPAINPYAPTSHVSEMEGHELDVESFRRSYLSHEASIKSIGILYLIPGILLLVFFSIAAVGGVVGMVTGDVFGGGGLTEALVVMALVALQAYAGWGLRRFKTGAKLIVTVFSTIGLLAIPVGTLINVYILYLLYGEKGKVVFSDAYQDAIRQTPHIKYQTSTLVKVFVGLLILLIAVGIVSALFVS